MSRHIKIATNGELIEDSDILSSSSSSPLSSIDCADSTAFPDDDPVNNPPHYQSLCKDGIDCITAMRHAFGDDVVSAFCICNVFKYTWRHQSKNGKQDLEKAQWYLNKYLELNK